MTVMAGRRRTLQTLGIGIAAGVAILVAAARSGAVLAAEAPAITPPGAVALKELMERLDEASRRRSFKTVPMILTEPDQWDHEALSEVLAYKPGTKQVWDMTEWPARGST